MRNNREIDLPKVFFLSKVCNNKLQKNFNCFTFFNFRAIKIIVTKRETCLLIALVDSLVRSQRKRFFVERSSRLIKLFSS